MKKEWFFDRCCGYQYVALLEEGKLVEFAAEKEGCGDLVGNIYKGKVTNVLSGMQAAFISCGFERNCYLPLEDTYENTSKYDGVGGALTSNDLKVGDEVIVQVVKPPRGNKGAKVTTHISFVGKNLIYLPGTDFLGISRKIVEEKMKTELWEYADKLREKGEGFIVRTNAQLSNKKALKSEAAYLKKLYTIMKKKAETAQIGEILHGDLELPVRIMRDTFGDEVEAMHVGDKQLYNKLLSLAKLRGNLPEKKLDLYKGNRALYRAYGIDVLIREAASPVVNLKDGGNIVMEQTEAMTVVDVNSASFVGDISLEDTAFKVNMQATEEIARQVRLRNVGGIVVVDYIDMTEEEHKNAVIEKLTELLEKDKAKCRVLPMSDLCLAEFTRKRVGNDVNSVLVKPCESCKAKGFVASNVMLANRLRADIFDCFANGYNSAIIELNEGLMRFILDNGVYSSDLMQEWKTKRVYMVPHKTYKEDYYTIKGDNSDVLNLSDKAQILY